MMEARNGHTAVVAELLKDNRVNPDAVNLSGQTASMIAAHCSHTAVVELLNQARMNANVAVAKTNGDTAHTFNQ